MGTPTLKTPVPFPVSLCQGTDVVVWTQKWLVCSDVVVSRCCYKWQVVVQMQISFVLEMTTLGITLKSSWYFSCDEPDVVKRESEVEEFTHLHLDIIKIKGHVTLACSACTLRVVFPSWDRHHLSAKVCRFHYSTVSFWVPWGNTVFALKGWVEEGYTLRLLNLWPKKTTTSQSCFFKPPSRVTKPFTWFKPFTWHQALHLTPSLYKQLQSPAPIAAWLQLGFCLWFLVSGLHGAPAYLWSTQCAARTLRQHYHGYM